ncbi:MAG TPA: hypothetical protein VGV09_09840 [Steroidobacteraceae bacterium]|nr:hypothetical protein [Steroidobacteraceae bacterium]
MAIDIGQALRLHAVSFIAAVSAGCALIWLVDAGYPYAFQPLHENLAALRQHPWTGQAALRVAGMEMCDLLADALICVAVWVVIRIHRSHPRAVLSVFAAAVTARYLPGLARLALHAAIDPRFTGALVSHHLHLMMPVAWQALCILAAGLWLARRPRFRGSDRLTYLVAILAASLYLIGGLARGAGLVGEIAYPLRAQYALDILNIASVVCLVPFLWHPNPEGAVR